MKEAELKWGTTDRMLTRRLISRMIYTVHMEKAISMDSFMVESQNCGSDENGMLK